MFKIRKEELIGKRFFKIYLFLYILEIVRRIDLGLYLLGPWIIQRQQLHLIYSSIYREVYIDQHAC